MSTNLALNKNAAASSCVSPFTPSRAVDGRLEPVRRWVCAQLPGTLTVDLGEYYWVDFSLVKHMGLIGWSNQYNIKSYILKGSTDHLNWTTLAEVNNNTASSNELRFNPHPVRWIQIAVANGQGLTINPLVASLAELEVYESQYNPYLKSLTISSGTLTPVFNQKTFMYNVEVGKDIPSVSVTPTAAASGAAIMVNNNLVQSGHPSPPIDLPSATTDIGIVVTNGPVQEKYTVIVTKVSSAVYLSGLTMKNPRGQAIILNPAFAPKTMTYAANANYPTVTVTPSSPGNTIKVNGQIVSSGSSSNPIDLSIGTNQIAITVSPSDGSSISAYTINVNRTS